MEQKTGVRLEIKNISKTFYSKKGESHLVVDNVSFDVKENEFLVLLGPGHCGKTVMLNMISGLMERDSGDIALDGEIVTSPNPKMGMVFQKLGLMPWKTVMENVEIGPKMRGVSVKERREKAAYYINLVGLGGFENSYPHQLSGGMKQRVGIARAYTNDPEILIMDEPFGQLDAQTRYNMQNEIARITSQEKRTIIFVTNNIEEAVYLGDRIILLTDCPAKVKEIYTIDLARPRDVIDPLFLNLRKEISGKTDLAL
ncbi:ABC transporter ATP-binding protein [Petroclostridium sp. X23]|uniref:ABC transporter ATP-binding protein n=1 Tax=Petroclostridium sp. X23 TaxID=3045146 RepID=UPI0024AC83D1|nr:ABC transporter ATP-binding protein [Petroclostridium sp. X23]WHH56843.1 ABC transporter ATP-binding protein [Petroclostridium sp. X23]